MYTKVNFKNKTLSKLVHKSNYFLKGLKNMRCIKYKNWKCFTYHYKNACNLGKLWNTCPKRVLVFYFYLESVIAHETTYTVILHETDLKLLMEALDRTTVKNSLRKILLKWQNLCQNITPLSLIEVFINKCWVLLLV